MAWKGRGGGGGAIGGWGSGANADRIELQEQEAQGGGKIPAGTKYFASEDPRTGDVVAVYKTADETVILARTCKFTGAVLGEAELKPAGRAGFAGSPAATEGEEPEAWSGRGWTFAFEPAGVFLSRKKNGGSL